MSMIKETVNSNRTKLELMVGDEAVSGLIVVDLDMRVGHLPLRCGGIAGVETKSEKRMAGYGRQLLEASVKFMTEQGYHLSALFGIPDFYPKFGFAPAFVDCESRIATRDAELAPKRYAVRELDLLHLDPQDQQAMLAIYEQRNSQRTATIVRNAKNWRGFRKGAGWTHRIGAFAIGEGSQILAYVVYNLTPWAFVIGEIGYTTTKVFSTILAEAAQRAWAKRTEQIVIHTPPDDLFLSFCQAYGCETKLTYRRNADGMARMINQKETLGALEPLLRQRVQEAGWASKVGRLAIATDLGKGDLALGDGPDFCLEVPQTVLTQWVLGHRPVRVSAIEHGLSLADDETELLEIVFPAGMPYIYEADRF